MLYWEIECNTKKYFIEAFTDIIQMKNYLINEELYFNDYIDFVENGNDVRGEFPSYLKKIIIKKIEES